MASTGDHHLPSIPRVKLGPEGFKVSALGLGCMGMSAFYGCPKPEAEMIELIRYAVNSGVTFLNTADAYGSHTNEVLVGKVGAMEKLVEERKVKHLGLSGISASSEIRRAHAVHPITTVQLEQSLWTRYAEEEIVPTCRKLGIAIVPYSPLGRGFFASYNVEENKGEGDICSTLPRMLGENLEKNNRLRARLLAISEEKKCSLNQLALAWILHKGKDVVPIPGTSKKVNLESNIGAIGVTLSKEEIVETEAAMPIAEISGDRNLDNQSIHSTMQQSTTSFTERLPVAST